VPVLSVEEIVRNVNVFLRGCSGYFRYGNSARPFDKIQTYALARLSLFCGEAPSQAEKLRLADGRLRVAEPDGPDQPQRARRSPTTEPAVAG
jgi:hypothetical protein